MLVGSLEAATPITSSFGTVASNTDDDQATKFVRGVEYKILSSGTYSHPTDITTGLPNATHTLTPVGIVPPGAIEATLQSLSFQTSSCTTDINKSPLYVSIFTGLTVDSNGNVTSLGTFIASSTNSQQTALRLQKLTWNFNNVLLNINSSYQFVFTTTNNPLSTSDISRQALETRYDTNLLGETKLIGGNSTAVSKATCIDPVFEMKYTVLDPNPIPEPSSAMLGALTAGLALTLRRRRNN